MSLLEKIKLVMDAKNYSLYRALRKEKRMSITKVAMAAGVSPETQWRTERGERIPGKDEVIRMDHLFNCNGELINTWLGRSKLSRGKRKSPAISQTKLEKIFCMLSIARLKLFINWR